MSRTATERIQDRLFLLKLIKELDIPNPSTLENIVLLLQLILLEARHPKIFSYQFYKSRLGFSEKQLFSDLSDLHRAELISYTFPRTEKEELRITDEGRRFLEDFAELLDGEKIQNFNFALKQFKEIGLKGKDLDEYIRGHSVVLATKLGNPVLI